MLHCLFNHTGFRTLLALGFIVNPPVTAMSGSFFGFDLKRLEPLTRDAGFDGSPFVCRDEAGTKLFVMGRSAAGKSLVEIISSSGCEIQGFDCGRPMLGDGGQLICCVTNHRSLTFATGEAIPIVFEHQAPARFEFSPGAAYFLLDRAANPADALPLSWRSAIQVVPFLTPGATNMGEYVPHWVGVFRSAKPLTPLFRLPNDFYASRVFTIGNQIFLSGFKFAFGAGGRPGRPGLEMDVAWGLLFSPQPSGYQLTRQVDLSSFSGVIDADRATGTLLVRTKTDMFPKWGLLRIEENHYEPVGPAKEWGFFLDAHFSSYLERVLK